MPTLPDGFPLEIVGDGDHNAFPGVARMDDGNLVLVYRKGSDHEASLDGMIVARISADHGESWGPEATVSNPSDDARDPEVTVLASGRVIVLFRTYDGAVGTVFVVHSDDNAETWVLPSVAVNSSFSDERQVGKIVQLPGGELIAPMYGTNGGDRTAFLMRSADQGATWGTQTTIATGSGRDWTEPVIVRLADGTLHCLIRVDDLAEIWRTVSTDDGATWSSPAFAFVGQGKPEHLELTSGALLYVGRPVYPGDSEWRTSTDDGVSWSPATTLDDDLDNMAYASLVEIDDDHVLCIYAIEEPHDTYTVADIRSQVFETTSAGGGGSGGAVAPGKAILEIYVHDEDASRWGEATWATGPATGTEGIWSAAGWTDVTPQGVTAHIIWGSRRPERGILAQQNAASWNVETYDPDRKLDPGNPDSPYAPQLVAGLPIRISHDSLVIRTGYCDRIAYKYKPPHYAGQILATDTISLMNQAQVPADSILGNTLLERIQDAITAAGIAVGGIPLPPPSPAGPAIANWVEGAALDDPTSVWSHVLKATEEVLWVAFINADGGLGLRAWGAPLERGREINAPNLEDLEAVSSEDGLYSVARVQVEDPDLDPIEREASPLPRYGRRMIERDDPTVDPEGWAAAVLAERAWPGVQYVPGTIHCFSAADVNYFGSLEIMERVQVTHPGVVSVSGRILGGELFVQHFANADRGATWQFLYAVATDGSTAIGLTTLVADGTGDVLLDDASETDYLEAD